MTPLGRHSFIALGQTTRVAVLTQISHPADERTGTGVRGAEPGPACAAALAELGALPGLHAPTALVLSVQRDAAAARRHHAAALVHLDCGNKRTVSATFLVNKSTAFVYLNCNIVVVNTPV